MSSVVSWQHPRRRSHVRAAGEFLSREAQREGPRGGQSDTQVAGREEGLGQRWRLEPSGCTYSGVEGLGMELLSREE